MIEPQLQIRPLPAQAFASYLEQVNRYAQREAVESNEATKAPQRADVLGYITNAWPKKAKSVRVLTFPSSNWRFEASLRDFDERTFCVAVERHWTVIARGLHTMPGFKRSPFSYPTLSGTIEGIRSEHAQITYLHASAYLGLGRTAARSKPERRVLRNAFHMLHAAWLDFQSPLCLEVTEALRMLPVRMDAWANMKRFPVVVTMLAAREAPLYGAAIDALGGRAAAVVHALDCSPYMRAHYVASRTYVTQRGIPMLATFVGLEPVKQQRFEHVRTFFRAELENLDSLKLEGDTGR